MVPKYSKKENKKEMACFDPPIKHRYFPGEVSDIEAKVDFATYKRHRMRLVDMKAVVDNKAPRFAVHNYYDREKLNEDARIANLNYKKNLELTKRLNYVSRMGGKVDCWNDCEVKLKTDEINEKRENNKRIMRVNKALYEKINSFTSEYSPQAMAKEWKLLKGQIQKRSRFPWFKEVSRYPSITQNAVKPSNAKDIRRRKCFFDLELGESKLPLGRIVFQLYTDYVPSICANFESFCKGFRGLSYKGTPFHRILSGYWCQGGDVTKFNGTGGASIYEDAVPGENFTLQHTCPGVLTTCIDEQNLCDSKFNLTFRPLRTMDEKKVVFGKVVKGMQVLYKIDAYGTKFGKPLQKVVVSNCGIVPFKKKHFKRSSKESEESKTSENGGK